MGLFERPFKIQKNGVFRFEISFFVLEMLEGKGEGVSLEKNSFSEVWIFSRLNVFAVYVAFKNCLDHRRGFTKRWKCSSSHTLVNLFVVSV